MLHSLHKYIIKDSKTYLFYNYHYQIVSFKTLKSDFQGFFEYNIFKKSINYVNQVYILAEKNVWWEFGKNMVSCLNTKGVNKFCLTCYNNFFLFQVTQNKLMYPPQIQNWFFFVRSLYWSYGISENVKVCVGCELFSCN